MCRDRTDSGLNCMLVSDDVVTSHRIKCINYNIHSFRPMIKFFVLCHEH